MGQSETPLLDALLKWKQMNPLSFHVPGHKNGKFFSNQAIQLYEKILAIDATEITDLDDLHEPEGAILQAQRLAAQWYGSKESFFLVGGSTAGNLAMILATCKEQEIVFVQRNSHKSIMHGLELANAKPVFLTPIVDDSTNAAACVSIETVKAAYAAYPDVKAIILTNPNYYGMTADLKPIIAFAQEHGMTVLIDEAHGAHFGIGKPFPDSAVSKGADVVVQSAHKTLPAMTMGSFLHVNERYPHLDKLKTFLAMLQSSSPSYPIMASLDAARHYVSQLEKKDIQAILESIGQFLQSLQAIEHIRAVHSELPNYEQDPLKVIVQSKVGISGFELQKQLERQAVFTELADENNVLFVMPLAPFAAIDETVERMEKAFAENGNEPPRTGRIEPFAYESPFSTLALSYKEMANASKRYAALDEAIGKIAAEAVVPYPPGIPLVMKGEMLSLQHVDALKRFAENKARFQGGSKLHENQILIFQ